MSVNRRSFLQKAGIVSATAFLSSLTKPAWSRNLDRAIREAEQVPPGDLASDEEFWYYIQQSFTVSSGLINLNNGGVSPAPRTVQEAMKRYYDLSNEAPRPGFLEKFTPRASPVLPVQGRVFLQLRISAGEQIMCRPIKRSTISTSGRSTSRWCSWVPRSRKCISFPGAATLPGASSSAP